MKGRGFEATDLLNGLINWFSPQLRMEAEWEWATNSTATATAL